MSVTSSKKTLLHSSIQKYEEKGQSVCIVTPILGKKILRKWDVHD